MTEVTSIGNEVEPRVTSRLRGRRPIQNVLERPLLAAEDLVLPVLVQAGSLPRRSRVVPTTPLDDVPRLAREVEALGIRGVKLFASATEKSPSADEAASSRNPMCLAIEAFKDAAPDLCVLVETCLCSYTEDGHCVLRNADGTIDSSGSLAVLAEMGLCQAAAGADVLGPAGMLEGSVRAVRQVLDEAERHDVAIMPHVIFASSLYRFYREAMSAAPQTGDRRPFHADLGRPEQAVEAGVEFCAEGADMLLLEPALPVVDALVELRRRVRCPLAAFSVSGEYHVLKAALAQPEGAAVALELLAGLRRAGADLIVTYGALELAAFLRRDGARSSAPADEDLAPMRSLHRRSSNGSRSR